MNAAESVFYNSAGVCEELRAALSVSCRTVYTETRVRHRPLDFIHVYLYNNYQGCHGSLFWRFCRCWTVTSGSVKMKHCWFYALTTRKLKSLVPSPACHNRAWAGHLLYICHHVAAQCSTTQNTRVTLLTFLCLILCWNSSNRTRAKRVISSSNKLKFRGRIFAE